MIISRLLCLSDEDFWFASTCLALDLAVDKHINPNTINLHGRIPFLKIPTLPTSKRPKKPGRVLAFHQLIIIILLPTPTPSNEDEKAFVLSDDSRSRNLLQ